MLGSKSAVLRVCPFSTTTLTGPVGRRGAAGVGVGCVAGVGLGCVAAGGLRGVVPRRRVWASSESVVNKSIERVPRAIFIYGKLAGF